MLNKKVMSIMYEVRDNSNQELLDSNLNKQPLEFILGNNEVIQGLDEGLLNAELGGEYTIIVPPAKGYGERAEEAIEEVAIDQFEGIELERGMTLFGQGENGEHIQVVVKDFNDQSVIIDYNHPLAGKELIFEIKVVGVRLATENELTYGVGYDQHGGGGCCGGGGGGGCCGGHHH